VGVILVAQLPKQSHTEQEVRANSWWDLRLSWWWKFTCWSEFICSLILEVQSIMLEEHTACIFRVLVETSQLENWSDQPKEPENLRIRLQGIGVALKKSSAVIWWAMGIKWRSTREGRGPFKGPLLRWWWDVSSFYRTVFCSIRAWMKLPCLNQGEATLPVHVVRMELYLSDFCNDAIHALRFLDRILTKAYSVFCCSWFLWLI